MPNDYCLDLTVVSSFPVPVSHRHPPLFIRFVEINAQEGAGLETAVRVDEALIAPATFICRWRNKEDAKGKASRPDFATEVRPSEGCLLQVR